MNRLLFFGFLVILVSVSVLGNPVIDAWGKAAGGMTKSASKGYGDAIKAGGEAVSGMGEAAGEGMSQSAPQIGG